MHTIGTIQGYAATYGTRSRDVGGFYEILRRGAFADTIYGEESRFIRCLFNHEANLVLGTRGNGTLRLRDDSVGLWFEADLPDTQAGRDVKTLVSRGDVNGCSFAFKIPQPDTNARWYRDGSDIIREVKKADLYDVSPVTYPAYPGTSLSGRAIHPSQIRMATRPGLDEAISKIIGIDFKMDEAREPSWMADAREKQRISTLQL